jgi:uncharacterized protein YukE
MGLPGRPGGNPGHLFDAKDALYAMADGLQATLDTLRPTANANLDFWSGPASNAYGAVWSDLYVRFSDYIQTVRALANLVDQAGTELHHAQQRYDHLVELMVGGAVLAGVAAVFTFGGSEAADAAADAAIVEEATSLVAALGSSFSSIGSAIAALDVDALVAAFEVELVPSVTAALATPAGMAAIGGGSAIAMGARDPESIALGIFTGGLEGAAGTEGPVGPVLDEEQVALESKTPVDIEDISGQGNINGTYKVTYSDGTSSIYKPAVGEAYARTSVTPGTYYQSEVAGYQVSAALNLDVVPPTTFVGAGTPEVGSAQAWADGASPSMPASNYSAADQERMGVLDYVEGNTDRHPGNYLTDAQGHPVAIDNGLSFPTTTAEPIRSNFVVNILDKPLSQPTIDAARAINTDDFAATLRASGLSDSAVQGAVARLQEVQSGMITGQAWTGAGGKIADIYWTTVRGPQ